MPHGNEGEEETEAVVPKAEVGVGTCNGQHDEAAEGYDCGHQGEDDRRMAGLARAPLEEALIPTDVHLHMPHDKADEEQTEQRVYPGPYGPGGMVGTVAGHMHADPRTGGQ